MYIAREIRSCTKTYPCIRWIRVISYLVCAYGKDTILSVAWEIPDSILVISEVVTHLQSIQGSFSDFALVLYNGSKVAVGHSLKQVLLKMNLTKSRLSACIAMHLLS